MTLAIDRKAFFDIITDGVGHVGATMMPPPERRLGHAGRDAEDVARL